MTMKRPASNNADHWQLFLSEWLRIEDGRIDGLAYCAVQIAEALDEARAQERERCAKVLRECRTSIAGYHLRHDPGEAAKLVSDLFNELQRIDKVARAALAQPVSETFALELEWREGAPPHPWREEWFIAETTYGDRVVLCALPEEYAYDFKTADATYIKADKIKRWMQFPDSQYCAPAQPVSEPLKTWIIRKGGYFYRPNAQGYTVSIHEAGRYTQEEAEAHAASCSGEVSAHPASEFARSGLMLIPREPTDAMCEHESYRNGEWSRRNYEAIVRAFDASEREGERL